MCVPIKPRAHNFPPFFPSLAAPPQSYVNIFATILNVVVALFIIIAIPSMATSTQSASFVFTEYINGSNGVASPVYVYLLGTNR